MTDAFRSEVSRRSIAMASCLTAIKVLQPVKRPHFQRLVGCGHSISHTPNLRVNSLWDNLLEPNLPVTNKFL